MPFFCCRWWFSCYRFICILKLNVCINSDSTPEPGTVSGRNYVTSVHPRNIFLLCMECQRGLVMRKLSVCLTISLSVCLSNAWIVTKRKKDMYLWVKHTCRGATGIISSAGWANSITCHKWSLCLYVHQGSTNHNHYSMQRLVILQVQTYLWTLIANQKLDQSVWSSSLGL